MNIYLGDKNNKAIYEELSVLKNMLICGGPGGGKTVYFSRLIKELSSTYSPNDIKFVIHDSNGVDYFNFGESQFLLFPITDDRKIDDFKKQFDELKKIAKDRCDSRETKAAIIVLIDEFYMLSYWFEKCDEEIIELAKISDQTNIHFFISSQRPNNLGKSLLTAIENKICYRLSSKKESKDFIGVSGGQNMKLSGQVLALLNGKLEQLQQKPFDEKMYV